MRSCSNDDVKYTEVSGDNHLTNNICMFDHKSILWEGMFESLHWGAFVMKTFQKRGRDGAE